MTSVPGATTESPDGSLSGLPWKMTVTPLWVEMTGCSAGVPDISYGWQSRYPDNVQEACQTILDGLFFLAMNSSPSTLPNEGDTAEARDQWCKRVQSAIDGTASTGIPVNPSSALAAGSRRLGNMRADQPEAQSALDEWFRYVLNGRSDASSMSVLKTADEMARSLGIEIQYQGPRPEDETGEDLGDRGRRLKVWAGDRKRPGVWIVLPDADDAVGTADTAGTHDAPAATDAWSITRGAAARTTLSKEEQHKRMLTLIDRWSRNKNGTPGTPARVASTAGYAIKAMSPMGFRGVRTRMLLSGEAYDEELEKWESAMQASESKEAPSEQ